MTDRELMQRVVDSVKDVDYIDRDIFRAINEIRLQLKNPEKQWNGLTDTEKKDLKNISSEQEMGFQDGALWAASILKSRNYTQ